MGSCFGRSTSKEPHTATTSCFCDMLRLKNRATDDQESELMSNISSGSNIRENFIYRIIKFKSKRRRSQFIDKFWEHQDMQYAKLSSSQQNGADANSNNDIQLQNLDVYNLISSAQQLQHYNQNKESNIQYSSAVASSRASSSLDLEWEHEYAHIMRHYANASLANPSILHQRDNQQQQLNNMSKLLTNHQNSNDDSWQCLTHDESEFVHSFTSLLPPNGKDMNHQSSMMSSNDVNSMQVKSSQPLTKTRSIPRNSSHNSWSHISTPESLEWDIDEEQQKQMRVEDDNLGYETLELLHQIEQLKNQVLNETGDGLIDLQQQQQEKFDDNNQSS